MSDQHQRPEAEFDRIDADAVCEACGTVNPEDTLFCKSCGNNLRDQRVSRISEGRGSELLAEPSKPHVEWLSKALAVLGILVVIWTAINVSNGNIEKWLTSTQRTLETGPGPGNLWRGSDNIIYEGLRKQIAEHPVTSEEIERASNAGPAPKGFDGRYIIKSSAAANSAVIGQGAAKEDDDRVLFLAILSYGAEVRGVVDKGADVLKTTQAGVKISDHVLPAFGIAQRAKDGGLMCYGQQRNENDEDLGTDTPSLSAVAYRIPSS